MDGAVCHAHMPAGRAMRHLDLALSMAHHAIRLHDHHCSTSWLMEPSVFVSLLRPFHIQFWSPVKGQRRPSSLAGAAPVATNVTQTTGNALLSATAPPSFVKRPTLTLGFHPRPIIILFVISSYLISRALSRPTPGPGWAPVCHDAEPQWMTGSCSRWGRAAHPPALGSGRLGPVAAHSTPRRRQSHVPCPTTTVALLAGAGDLRQLPVRTQLSYGR